MTGPEPFPVSTPKCSAQEVLNYFRKNVTCVLTLNPPTWKIWWAPNNASRWQVGFNSAFKGLTSVWVARCLRGEITSWRTRETQNAHKILIANSRWNVHSGDRKKKNVNGRETGNKNILWTKKYAHRESVEWDWGIRGRILWQVRAFLSDICDICHRWITVLGPSTYVQLIICEFHTQWLTDLVTS